MSPHDLQSRLLRQRRLSITALLLVLSTASFVALDEGGGLGFFIGCLCSLGYWVLDMRLRKTEPFRTQHLTPADNRRFLACVLGAGFLFVVFYVLLLVGD